MRSLSCSFLLFSLLFSNISQADTLAVELHNTESWNPPRIGVNLKLSERIHFIARKGIGGPDPTALVGYSLPLKDFTFVLRLGGNTDDALKPVYWRTEVLVDFQRDGFDICLGESFAGAIDAFRKDNLYSKLTTDYAWEKFKFGVQTDQVWLLEKGEFMYWQVGPAVSVANILLWAGKDLIRENKFFRIALTLKI